MEDFSLKTQPIDTLIAKTRFVEAALKRNVSDRRQLRIVLTDANVRNQPQSGP